MTDQPTTTRTDLRKRADFTGHLYGPNTLMATVAEVDQLLDALDRFESKMHELDRAYISEHRQRKEAETERDRALNRASSETARANTWRDRNHGNIARVHRAGRAIRDAQVERNQAEARIQAVRGVCAGWEASDNWAALIAAGTIRRALDVSPD